MIAMHQPPNPGDPDTIDMSVITTDAERLLFEWYQQWWDDDTMPTKMLDGLHIRTAMYFQLKQHGGDPSILTETVEPEPGHDITDSTDGAWAFLVCECGWKTSTLDTETDNAKKLHWLAKKIEREALVPGVENFDG